MDDQLSRRGFLRVGGLAAMAAAAGLGVTAVPALADAVLPPEDGYELWLRYRLVEDAKPLQDYRGRLAQLVVQESTPVMRSARDELSRALRAMLGQDVPVVSQPTASSALVIGTWNGSATVRRLVTRGDVQRAGDEGYLIRLVGDGDRDVVVVASMSERGVLYGAFALLRRLQRRQPLAGLDVVDRPEATLRLVDHWDNLSGTVERGYAGGSIFDWNALPALDPRYTDYARALASVATWRSMADRPRRRCTPAIPGCRHSTSGTPRAASAGWAGRRSLATVAPHSTRCDATSATTPRHASGGSWSRSARKTRTCSSRRWRRIRVDDRPCG